MYMYVLHNIILELTSSGFNELNFSPACSQKTWKVARPTHDSQNYC